MGGRKELLKKCHVLQGDFFRMGIAQGGRRSFPQPL